MKKKGNGFFPSLLHVANKKLNKYYDCKPFTFELLKMKKNNLIGLEIGVYRGINALNILKVLDIKKLYLIDIKITKDLLNLKLKNTIIIQGDSNNTYSLFNDNFFDFIYIDTIHDQRILNDIKNWLPKLKDGGLFGGHGFDACWDLPYYLLQSNYKISGHNQDWFLI